MRSFTLVLRIIAPLCFVVSALHVILGLGADALLGAHVPAAAMADPGLDSQNRFYGVAFALYGVLLLVCSGDVRKYATVLRAILWVVFAGGLARLISVAVYGPLPPAIVALFVSEVGPPPLLLWWLSRLDRDRPT